MALDAAMRRRQEGPARRRRRRRRSTTAPTWSTRSSTPSAEPVRGGVLVIAVLFAFLGNLRAGLIVASAIPLSMLFAVTMMERVGIAGSLLSLGAIDFGLVVDSSVVMVENCVRRLGARPLGPPEARRHPRRGRRGAQADAVRRADHHDRLPADPHARRDRGEAVPADGADGHLRPGRLDGPVAHADAGARLARPAAADVGAGDAASTASPTGSSSRSSGSGCGSRGRRSSSSARITVGGDRSWG